MEKWGSYHGLERLANTPFLLRDDVANDPERGIEVGDQEEDRVQHSDQIEELALSLPVIAHHRTHVSLCRKGHVRILLRDEQLFSDERLAVRLHFLQLLVIQHVQPITQHSAVLSFITPTPPTFDFREKLLYTRFLTVFALRFTICVWLIR